MSREFDRRRAPEYLLGAARQPAGGAVELPVDSLGSAGDRAAALGAAPAGEAGSYLERALEYAQAGTASGALGFAPTEPTDYRPDPQLQTTSGGATAVHLQQRYKGIPIYQASQTVQFDPQGALQGAVGRVLSLAEAYDPEPQLDAAAALLIAAQYLAAPQPDAEQELDQFGEPLQEPELQIDGYRPQPREVQRDAERRTIFEPGPFAAPPQAGLIWFPLDGALRLAWELVLTLPDLAGQYRIMVDAADGELLYCQELHHHLLVRGHVFLDHGAGARGPVPFPLPLADHGLPIPGDLPAGFPGAWIDDDQPVGNNAIAYFADDGRTVEGDLDQGAMTFGPFAPAGLGQCILNLFFYVNRMHDYFYLLGFREQDGNFQRGAVGPGGIGGDPVDARVFDGFVNGTATMLTLVDGQSPTMAMGRMGRTGNHSALDATVVYHEYAHGVSNRLVGGPQNTRALDAVQSRALGEGWSDFFACVASGQNVVGAWLSDQAGGIRGAPYDSAYPGQFGQLGQGRYRSIHAAGEIWCAALLELSRAIGPALCAQIVLDALRLAPANPTFLQARDAVLRAIDALQTADTQALREQAWRAFTRFGMGPAAVANDPRSLAAVVPDAGAQLEAPSTVALPAADDLAQLPWVDAAIGRKLRGAGITSPAQLAELTPARLARLIARAGVTAEFIRTQGWLEQAAALGAQGEPDAAEAPVAEARPREPERRGDLGDDHERQRPTSFTVRLNLSAANSVQKTEVLHIRDGARDEWAGWNERRLIDFMLLHAGIAAHQPAAATERLDAGPAQPEPVAVPSRPALFDGETVNQAPGDDRLRLQLLFQTDEAIGPATFVWEVVAHNLDSGQRLVLTNTEGRLATDSPVQQLDAVVDLPVVGQYKLSSTLLIPERQLFVQAAGPRLTVEARG
jgi:extracellular elastinolytic metalloproteinase